MTPMTIEEQIRAAFPESDSEEQRVARLALLRLAHACENAEESIDSVAGGIAWLLDDPVESIFNGILAENTERLARRLHALGSQVSRSASQLKALQSRWERFKVKEGSDADVRGEGSGKDDQTTAKEGPPF